MQNVPGFEMGKMYLALKWVRCHQWGGVGVTTMKPTIIMAILLSNAVFWVTRICGGVSVPFCCLVTS